MKAKVLRYRHMVLILFSFLLGACSSKPILEKDAVAPQVIIPKDVKEDSLHYQVSDPFEGFNRRMYYFNAKADEYVLLPVVEGYQSITPDFVETGISNFFNNLGEIPTFINALLQFKGGVATDTLGRFVLNTTLGMAGLLDVATPIGLPEQNEDFGQTLGFWGVDAGPYIVLPFLGPSSLRDTLGAGVDMIAFTAAVNELGLTEDGEQLLSLIRSIDGRASVPFRYYQSGSAFEYEKLRLLYLKYREIQIAR